jgi:hypothetical protein
MRWGNGLRATRQRGRQRPTKIGPDDGIVWGSSFMGSATAWDFPDQEPHGSCTRGTIAPFYSPTTILEAGTTTPCPPANVRSPLRFPVRRTVLRGFPVEWTPRSPPAEESLSHFLELGRPLKLR